MQPQRQSQPAPNRQPTGRCRRWRLPPTSPTPLTRGKPTNGGGRSAAKRRRPAAEQLAALGQRDRVAVGADRRQVATDKASRAGSLRVVLMASLNLTVQPDEPADVVHARLLATLSTATGSASGYQLSASPGLIVLIRRYRPTWAIVLAILGALFFLIGLLFLLVKNTETLTVSVTPRGDMGSTVTVAGQMDDWVIIAIQRVLTQPAPPAQISAQ